MTARSAWSTRTIASSGVLAPGTRQLYWRGSVNVRVEVRDIANEYALDANTARVLTRAKGVAGASDAISTVEVPDTSVGLLIVDGELREVLKPGLSAYWKYQRVLRVELVDLRLQTMEVSGQEILTRDKVSLRVNLTALWQVTDAVKARATVSNFVDYVYKELQFALREAVGTRTLDELLGDKGALDREVSASAAKLEASGLAVRSVGVKDVILPGEMKTILNQVVEAEKVAQANLIRRREETAATRSLSEHRAPHGREPDAAASEGTGDAGEGDGEDRQSDGLRRPRRRVEEHGAASLVDAVAMTMLNRGYMQNMNYETMNVEGGRHVKMWTRGVPVEERGEDAAREHRAHAVRPLAPGRDAGRARGQGRDRGLGDRNARRDHPGGGRCRHRLRHDGRADFAQGERSAGVIVGAAVAHRARRAARLGDRRVAATTADPGERRRMRCSRGGAR